MQHRHEIDGLRALAVLPVILFHAGLDGFAGGFIGVDVFFVISGYLITSIIVGEQAQGKFSLLTFYERRARRILPALFFVVLCCIPFAVMWMLPGDQRAFAQSMVAVSMFASNFLFWRQSGYFDAAAEEKPLLHTWSLAVEEQYYVVFPLLVMLIWPLGRKWFVATLCLIALASFAWAEIASTRFTSANFYLAPSRAWELLAGAFCALYLQNRPAPQGQQILPMIGLALIIGAIVAFDEATPFPSAWALIPVGGTVLIILFAHGQNLAARLLSWRLFVGIGLISYSAYLWHQPLFAFARLRSLNAPDDTTYLLLGLAALGLAYLSWRFIEAPFRDKQITSRGFIFAFAIIGTGLMIGAGLAGHFLIKPTSLAEGAQAKTVKIGDQTIALPAKFMGLRDADNNNCAERKEPSSACQFSGGAVGLPNIAIVGDSHARVLSQALHEAHQGRFNLIDFTVSGCPFLPDLTVYGNFQDIGCNAEFQQKRLEALRQIPNLTVIVSARWPLYIHGDGFDNSVGGIEYRDLLFAGTQARGSAAERAQEIAQSLHNLVAQLQAMGASVVLQKAVPPMGWNPVSRLIKIEKLTPNIDTDVLAAHMAVPRSIIDQRMAVANTLIDEIAAQYPGITIIDPKPLFCDADHCTSLRDGQLLYVDPDHLSQTGNQLLAKQIVRSLTLAD